MDLLRPRDLRALVEAPHEASVSIYMPSHRAGPETRQDPIRLKNLLGRAEEGLVEQGMRAPEAQELLAPAQELLGDEWFWQHQGDGLALFLSPSLRRSYRLPIRFEELVVAGGRFHIKPLLPLLSGDRRFLVLALSQNQIRLLSGTRQAVHEIELEDVPSSLRETAVHREMRVLQFHVGTGRPGGRRQVANFHGHGTEEDPEIVRKYFRRIDAGIREALPDERSPLVLAGVRYLLDLYREVSRYPNLVQEGVTGNPDEIRSKELHRLAWEVLEPRMRREQEEAAARYPELAERRLAISHLDQVVPAAHHGRVETLFVALSVRRWGVYDEESARVEFHDRPHPEDHDLLDLAAAQTLLNGGVVYTGSAGDVPGDGPIAALLRY